MISRHFPTAAFGLWLVIFATSDSIYAADAGSKGKRAAGKQGDQQEAAGVEQAKRPIAIGKETYTYGKLAPIYVEWLQQEWVRSYDEVGTHDQTWDAVAREYIADPEQLEQERWPFVGAHVWDLKAQLNRLKCTDALVSLLSWRYAPASKQRTQALRQAAEEITARNYAPTIKLLARAEAALASVKSKADLTSEDVQACLGLLRESVAGKALTPEAHWVWYRLLTSGALEFISERSSDEFLAAIDDLPFEQWFKLSLRGKLQIERAWAARGNGYADTVTEEGLRGFEDHLKQAAEALTESAKLNPHHPAAACGMIAVSMAASRLGDMRGWFDRAVAARLDEPDAYVKFLTGLRPRWLGSAQAVLLFGHACLETRRFDTSVPAEILQAISAVQADFPNLERTVIWKDQWPDLQRLVLGYGGSTNERARAFFLTTGAYMAYTIGKASECHDWLKELDYKLDPRAASYWQIQSSTWLLEASARTGPAKTLVHDALEFESSGQFAKSAPLLKKALALPDLDASAQSFIEIHSAKGDALQKLAGQPWASLLPGPDLAGWKSQALKSWSVDGEGSLGLSLTPSPALLFAQRLLKGPLELQTDFEFHGESDSFTEIALRLGGRDETSFFLVTIGHNPGRSDEINIRSADGRRFVQQKVELKDKNSLLLRQIAARTDLIFNGKEIFHDEAILDPDPPTKYVAVGGRNGKTEVNATLRFHKFEVRMAPEGNN